MTTHLMRDESGRITTVLTMSDVYEYKGFIFSVHHYCGPCKLKKNLEPAATEGRKFWKVWAEWYALSDDQKAGTKIH